MACGWQNIMQCFDPIALAVGSFQIHWYAICFLLAWIAALYITLYFETQHEAKRLMGEASWQDLFWWILFGGLVGGRLGHALFYEPVFFWHHPSMLFIPYNFTEEVLVSFRGMSFHGGLIGVALVLWVWSYQKKTRLLTLTDRLVLAAPIISIFGRLGNFLNQELPGRVTELPWGVYFPGESVLRHPSTLYGVLLEGFLLFGWMFFWHKKVKTPGFLTALYLASYAIIRFGLEYFREPDFSVQPWVTGLTQGQILSLGVLVGALTLWFLSAKHDKIDTNVS